jgi:hypothetical protein
MTKPQTYIAFFYEGETWREPMVQPVEDRNDPTTIPPGALAYRFFELKNNAKIPPEEITTEVIQGMGINESGRTFVDGKVLSEEMVKTSVPNSRMLLSNMQVNGWNYLVEARQGSYIPLVEGDRVVHGGNVIYPDAKAFPTPQHQR